MMTDSRPDWTTQRVPSQPEVYTDTLKLYLKKKKGLSGSLYFFVVYSEMHNCRVSHAF